MNEPYNTQDILAIVKRDVRLGKTIVLGFSERHCNNLRQHLERVNLKFHDLVGPLLENPHKYESIDGEIACSFSSSQQSFIFKINVIQLYVGKFIPTVNVIESKLDGLELFDLFCDAIKDFAIFATDGGNNCLTDLIF